ncbi:MFS general substrate transporter [Daedaleopsis nitida]|nr:MFS general substrate transporter [Daedaleopsis nitida]
MPDTPTVLSAQSSMVALRAVDPQEGTNVQELPPVDRGFRAWSFCAAAFVLEMMIWGFSFSFGIFQEYYTSHPPFNSSSSVSITAVGTVALALQFGEPLLMSIFLGRYPDFLRMSMWLGLAVYFVSLFASSFATNVWQLILLQGFGVGAGAGIAYMPVIRYLPEWFSERRGLAGGIIFAGTGIGGFVFPFLLTTLLEKVGLAWTLRICAIGTSLCAGIAMLGMRSRYPTPKFSAGQPRPKLFPPHLDWIKAPLFWSVIITNFVQGTAQFPVQLYIAVYTKNISDQFTATVILSLYNASATMGFILLGHMSDRFPYPSVMLVSAVASSLAAFLLWGFADAALYLYFFVIVFGTLSGGYAATWMNAAVDCTGGRREYVGIAFSATSFVKGIAAIVGPAISGLLLEAGQGASTGNGFGRFGFGAVELFVGSCALASGLGSLIVTVIRNRVVS